MVKVVVFTMLERQYKMLQKAMKKLQEKKLLSASSTVMFFSSYAKWQENMASVLKDADITLFIWQGPIFACDVYSKAYALLNERNSLYTFMSTAESSQDVANGISKEEIAIIRNYLLFSGDLNYQNLLIWLVNKVSCQKDTLKQPTQLPWYGLYNPHEENQLDNIESFLKRYENSSKKKVGLLFSREQWIWQDTFCIDVLIDELAKKELLAVPIFALWEDNKVLNAPGVTKVVEKFFYHNNKPIISAVINTFKVGITVSKQNQQDFLQKLDVPIIQAYNLLRPVGDWQESLVGMNPVELSVNIVQPEFDGVLHGGVVSSKETDEFSQISYQPIRERIEALVAKVKRWVVLSEKSNADKKVAVIFHNYPPNNASIGSAIGLDSPESVGEILNVMQKAGYQVDWLPKNSRHLMNEIIAGVTNDRSFLSEEQIEKAIGKMPKEVYQNWFNKRPEFVQKDLVVEWGEAPGEVFVHNNDLIIPGMVNGNVLITMQPPRGFGEDVAKIYHSPTCPPPHHYFAFYNWVKEIWQADAVVHVGTHGSLEWLPGKNAGLSDRCYPELALVDLPDIYPYYTTIVGEGIQAKRRGAACLISHLCPPMSTADTYEDLAELEKLLDEYAQYKTEQASNAVLVVEQIKEKIQAIHLNEDVPIKENELDDDYILRVHSYVEMLKNSQINTGLHILGQAPEEEVLKEMIFILVRSDNGKIPSLQKIVANLWGYDYYEMLEKSGELLQDSGKTFAQLLDEVNELSRQIIDYLWQNDFDLKALDKIYVFLENKSLKIDECLKEQLAVVLSYICTKLVLNLAMTNQELGNLLRALEGKYIEPAPGGAPSNGRADILPTGRNFYGVDPYNLPTNTAWQIGWQLSEQVISRFILEEGHYPESIGMVFWSDSNMRTNGKCVAEFFALMGVKPVWQKGSLRVIDVEVIPLHNLKRPRIDVTARVSGLFRDTMPSLMYLMEKAVKLVAELDEPDDLNYVRKHVQEDSKELFDKGLSRQEALEKACFRVFGCPAGGYGAGISALLEGKNWQSIDDLADVYVRWSSHVYGENVQGDFAPDLFRKRMGSIDVTIKNIDNHEVHLLSSDDFNAYCGGMNVAVKSIRGKEPRCYIGDSTDNNKVVLKSLDEEFRRVFRSESINPKFIEGMMKHDYKGASDLAALVAHAYGWDATSSVMKDWMYDTLTDKFVFDKKVQDWMKRVNPWALKRLTETLLEAAQRDLWKIKSQTKEQLESIYLSIEGELEEKSDK